MLNRLSMSNENYQNKANNGNHGVKSQEMGYAQKSKDFLKSNNVKNDRLSTITPVPEITSSSQLNVQAILELFGPKVGPISSDYSCSFQLKSGRLYVGKHAACFYSNLFGFEHRFMIQWINVCGIKPEKTNGICIQTISSIYPDETEMGMNTEDSMEKCEQHVFKGLANRDEVMSILLNFHRRAVSKASGNKCSGSDPIDVDIQIPTSISFGRKLEEGNVNSSTSGLEDVVRTLFNLPSNSDSVSVKDQAGDVKFDRRKKQRVESSMKKESRSSNDNKEDNFEELWSHMENSTDPSFKEVALNVSDKMFTSVLIVISFSHNNDTNDDDFYQICITSKRNLNCHAHFKFSLKVFLPMMHHIHINSIT